MKIKLQKQNGFSLIELMIAILIGLIVLAATIVIYITTIQSSSNTIRSAQLNQDLGMAMTIMTNDIRRAGYWGGAVAGSDSRTNPFSEFQIHDFGGDADACILYMYDGLDSDSVVDPQEYYGFRVNGNTIEIKSGGSSTVADCTGGTWVDMLDSQDIEVTSLTFNSDSSKCKNVTTSEIALCSALSAPSTGDDIVQVRDVTIQLSGRAVDDIAIQSSLNNSIRVRNNRVYTQP